jgi:hypothetical protein
MPTHALVKWITEDDEFLIDTVSISSFCTSDRNKGLNEESIYSVRYCVDKKKYKAKLLLLGIF